MEIRRSYDRLIPTMGFPILVRRHLNIESGPWSKCETVPHTLSKSGYMLWSRSWSKEVPTLRNTCIIVRHAMSRVCLLSSSSSDRSCISSSSITGTSCKESEFEGEISMTRINLFFRYHNTKKLWMIVWIFWTSQLGDLDVLNHFEIW